MLLILPKDLLPGRGEAGKIGAFVEVAVAEEGADTCVVVMPLLLDDVAIDEFSAGARLLEEPPEPPDIR